MLEAVFTNVTQQFLHVRNFHHTGAAESFQRIVGKSPFADVTANHSILIVSGKTRETHRSGLHLAHARSEGIVLSHRAGDDLLVIHAHFLEKVLGQIAAMEADGLVWILAVVIVPIE